MKKQKIQAERMPRKMKKRYKNLIKFYGERRMEYNMAKNMSVICAAILGNKGNRELSPSDDYIKNLILAKCKESGITADEVAKIEYNDELQTATITLNAAGRVIMSILMEENK